MRRSIAVANCFFIFTLFALALNLNAAEKTIVVDQSGRGNFKSIQAAINSLSDSAATAGSFLLKTVFTTRRFTIFFGGANKI